MNRHSGGGRDERGSVMVIAALAMTALILFAALAIDVGVVWSSRTQSQNADDAAALAAASKMIKQVGTDPATVELGDAIAEGKTYAADNSTVSNPSVTVRDQDFTFGYWDLQSRTLDTSKSLTNPDLVTGVRVNVLMDGAVNDRSPTFLSGLIGRFGFDVQNTATAYLGFQGSFGEGEFDLPVAIDSCDLSTDGCGSDYCATIASPPNPCPLKYPQTGDGDVTCLEFSSTPEQNACWTVFDGENPSVNNPDLDDIVNNGNPDDVEVGDDVFLDNGDKTVTTRRIRDKFYGDGAFNGRPAGTDRYPPYQAPPQSDSWVVKLPVVECQNATNCAGGDPFAITGGVCFEIREVLSPPYDPGERLIKGRFLCSNSTDPNELALFYQYCQVPGDPPQGPGGCNFGFRASRVVLVK